MIKKNTNLMFLVVEKMSGYYDFPVIQRIIRLRLKKNNFESLQNLSKTLEISNQFSEKFRKNYFLGNFL